MIISPEPQTIYDKLPVPPSILREFRGAWVATVANIDWPDRPGETEEIAKKQMDAIVNRASDIHLNALIFQVRPSADAMYPSDYEPWSEFLTGKQGAAPATPWDPLEYLIHRAHERGIQVHAWFNPYRALSPPQKGPCCDTHISKTNPDVVKSYGKFLWMDPGEKFVQNRAANVILDVVRRYDIDGIHLDDYFYPYKEKDSSGRIIDFPDGSSWEQYLQSGGKLDRNNWRRRNVDNFVENVHEEIHNLKPWVLFGISPFGIYRPGTPTGIEAGVDQYADLYADPLKWFQKGWVDYLAPQLYWPMNQKPQAYEKLLDWWNSENKLHRHLWPGMYTGRMTEGGKNWEVPEILGQMSLNRSLAKPVMTKFPNFQSQTNSERGATGEIHFSFRVLQKNPKQVDQSIDREFYRSPALVPASSWMGTEPLPELDSVFVTDIGGGRLLFEPKMESGEPLYGWCELKNGNWSNWNFTSKKSFEDENDSTLAIVTVNRFGEVSKPKFFKIPS